MIKVWPLLTAQAIKAREQLRSEKRDNIDYMRERVAALEGEVEAATQLAHQAEIKLISALASYRLLASELLKPDPENVILDQAQELLKVYYPAPRMPEPAAGPDPVGSQRQNLTPKRLASSWKGQSMERRRKRQRLQRRAYLTRSGASPPRSLGQCALANA